MTPIRKALKLALVLSMTGAALNISPAYSKTILKKGRAKVIRETSDKTSCFPRKLNNILLKISKNFGKPVVVVSGYRSPKDNERRGGAKNSQHIKCKAADFRVPGVSMKRVGRYLARMKERGGAGFYCRGRFHVDVASRRSWGGCKAQFIDYYSDSEIDLDESVVTPYNGEIHFEEADHDHEDMNDYDEALYYENTYEI